MSISYCTNCGVELKMDDAFCPECGNKIEKKLHNNIQNPNNHGNQNNVANNPTNTDHISQKQKSNATSLILTFIWPGLGHLYLGDTEKGIILGVCTLISGFLILFTGFFIFIYWLYLAWAMYDANEKTNKINSGVF